MNKIFTLASLLLIATVGSAQNEPFVDITVVNNGMGELEVKVRPDGPFDEVFSSLVFTIRWNTADAANLGAVQQGLPEAIYMPIQKSGSEIDDSGFRYQVFAGFGSLQMGSPPSNTTWIGGMEYTLMTIPVAGASTFEIVNDAWTGNISNNGDYFVSLNGVDKTGIIYGGPISTSIDEVVGSNGIQIAPNPSHGDVKLIIGNSGAGTIQIGILDAVGQLIREVSVSANAGGHTQMDFDLKELPKGSYFFRVVEEESVQSVPFVLH